VPRADTLPPAFADGLEMLEPKTTWNLQDLQWACTGIAVPLTEGTGLRRLKVVTVLCK